MAPMPSVAPCPNCSGSNLYRSKRAISSGGGYAPNYLPGLGGFFIAGRFQLVVCRDCGLTRFFANRDAIERLADSPRWERAS
jgi:predicted nucleic-acid-binding Zn-ribbon protein